MPHTSSEEEPNFVLLESIDINQYFEKDPNFAITPQTTIYTHVDGPNTITFQLPYHEGKGLSDYCRDAYIMCMNASSSNLSFSLVSTYPGASRNGEEEEEVPPAIVIHFKVMGTHKHHAPAPPSLLTVPAVGGGTILAYDTVALNQLIEAIAGPEQPETEFVTNVFLLCLYDVTTPHQLLLALSLLCMPPSTATPQEAAALARTRLSWQRGVLRVLRAWHQAYPLDWTEDIRNHAQQMLPSKGPLAAAFKRFLKDAEQPSKPPSFASLAPVTGSTSPEPATLTSVQRELGSMKLTTPDRPALRRLSQRGLTRHPIPTEASELLELAPAVLAQVLARYLALPYLSMRPREALLYTTASEDAERAPCLAEIVSRTNRVTTWALSRLIGDSTMDESERRRAAMHLLRTCESLLETGQMQALFGLMGALRARAFQRLLTPPLKFTESKPFLRIQELTGVADNHAAYRALAEERLVSGAPLIPFVGVFGKDLVFTTDGNPPFKQGQVNFRRMIMRWETVCSFLAHQLGGDLPLVDSPDLTEEIDRLGRDFDAWEQSEKLKPRGR
eukprot:gnl/Dysnectes_brevis/9374_a17365_118.p1 GENE.gnl/Dysnectes_brevis/9374_a17365_118~~gnl/Dysnectes_brevis/9374_a17365_118.p1  ORF type:complete len:559 (-),score=194.76 gnl/Dysnectes_brevis/9374_a17365_118:39-1715(-)